MDPKVISIIAVLLVIALLYVSIPVWREKMRESRIRDGIKRNLHPKKWTKRDELRQILMELGLPSSLDEFDNITRDLAEEEIILIRSGPGEDGRGCIFFYRLAAQQVSKTAHQNA